ncbi:hypothetical protein SAMN05444678_105166 [Sphingomonas sp. YR710]|uniref:hypothetical protein n=1 Tax=Sphingomonas sp. YR710 TaxID=1882773 RepID=UPI00089012A9|nr:hypothetical protein [Sphingomonas sp. YR710]SDC76323.1 hypothetical protein SAMN05444678_105166 [Sphingomonas sp. YR710]
MWGGTACFAQAKQGIADADVAKYECAVSSVIVHGSGVLIEFASDVRGQIGERAFLVDAHRQIRMLGDDGRPESAMAALSAEVGDVIRTPFLHHSCTFDVAKREAQLGVVVHSAYFDRFTGKRAKTDTFLPAAADNGTH